MKIRTQDYAVVLQGGASVVRNSVIETDSGSSLWVYGPNAIVENNTFIVHCIDRPMSRQGVSHCDAMDAPIRLMHGDGAIIRNNTFVLRDSANLRALSIFDTGHITFEGNTVVGLKKPAEAVSAFSGSKSGGGAVEHRVVDSERR